MANIIHIRITTNTTFNIPDTDSKSAVTTNFIEILCEINRRGLNVLNSLKIFTTSNYPELKITFMSEATTIKKSKIDHESLR